MRGAALLFALLAAGTLQAQEPVEIHGTAGADRVEISRAADGPVTVRLWRGGAGGPPSYEQTFHPSTTPELRVHLGAGDDVATLEGSAGGMVVRVVGGAGDDAVTDRSGGPTRVYDAEGADRVVRGADTRVSRRASLDPYEDDELTPDLERDWGARASLFTPYADLRSYVDVVVGGGPQWTRYAFRHRPYAARVFARGLYAPTRNRFGVEAGARFGRESSTRRVDVAFAASNLEATRYHGLGNDAPEVETVRARVWHERVEGEVLLRSTVARGLELALGPTVTWTRPNPEPGSLAEEQTPLGLGAMTLLGARGVLALDTRDDPGFPRRGARGELAIVGYPGSLGPAEPFARVDARASTYLSLPIPARPVLALRAGGSRVVGEFPFYEAAFLGGSRSLRGFRTERFAGDLAVFAGAELRLPLFPLETVLPGTVGALGFVDAGRVYVDGESPGGWHHATGPGVWYATSRGTVAASIARGETTKIYLKLGLPF